MKSLVEINKTVFQFIASWRSLKAYVDGWEVDKSLNREVIQRKEIKGMQLVFPWWLVYMLKVPPQPYWQVRYLKLYYNWSKLYWISEPSEFNKEIGNNHKPWRWGSGDGEVESISIVLFQCVI